MKELNELVELAKEFDASTTVEAAMAINSQFKAAATRETILAIAEAFRALEQRAEAAEAKLAEYDKQKPFGFCNEDAKNSDVFSATVWREKEDAESRSYGLDLFPLFTRPAPAVIQLNNDAMCDSQYIAGLQAGFVLGDRGDNDSLMRAVDAYRRQLLDSKKSAPAVSLAELVPDEMTWNEAHKLLSLALCGEDRFAAFMMGANHNRKEILRNIEDKGV